MAACDDGGLLVLLLQKALAAQMAAMRVRRCVKTDIKCPADVRKRASATTLRVMQQGGVGRWKDIHRIIYVWYPFAKMVCNTVYIVQPFRRPVLSGALVPVAGLMFASDTYLLISI